MRKDIPCAYYEIKELLDRNIGPEFFLNSVEKCKLNNSADTTPIQPNSVYLHLFAGIMSLTHRDTRF